MSAQEKLIFMLAGALIWEGLTLVFASILRAYRIYRRTNGESHDD